jgi:hypothetical protein
MKGIPVPGRKTSKYLRLITAVLVTANCFVWDLASSHAETFGEAAAALGQRIVGPLTWLENLNGGGDVNGQVGYIFNLPGPRLDCQGWTLKVEKISGQLPPGVSLKSDGSISGVPTEGGNYVATIRISNVMCGGFHYTMIGLTNAVALRVGFRNLDLCFSNLSPPQSWTGGNCRDAVIAFHITGSGTVHQ